MVTKTKCILIKYNGRKEYTKASKQLRKYLGDKYIRSYVSNYDMGKKHLCLYALYREGTAICAFNYNSLIKSLNSKQYKYEVVELNLQNNIKLNRYLITD